jgi:threonine/homoserine/homoserine lactone efflux protein
MHGLGAFFGIALLVIVTPGQDTALTVRNAVAGGRSAGMVTVFGIVTGQFIWSLATSAGLAALLVASAPAFTALRLAGAAYLGFLGVRALLSALRPASERDVAEAQASRPAAIGTAYRQGLISNLGNAKVAVFFTSLLPQFAAPGPDSFWNLLGLGWIFCTTTLIWLAGYAALAARAGHALRRPRIRRVLDGIVGAVFLAFGIRLATERR